MKKKSPSFEFGFSLGVPAIIWQFLFFYAPLLILVISSFLTISDSGFIEGVSAKKILFFINPLYGKVILASLILALTTAFLCLLIAYPVAYFMAIVAKKFKNLLLILLIIPFWTNFLLHVYAWFFVLEREGFLNNLLRAIGFIQEPLQLLNSPFAILVMMVYYYLPFMVLPLYASLERFDLKLVEASLDLGASSLQTFRRIMLPLTLRGVRTGFFLVYIPAFGEFAIPELMGGDKQMFVGSVVSHYILGEQTGSLGAAFTVVSCCALLLSAVAFYFLINRFLTPKKGVPITR